MCLYSFVTGCFAKVLSNSTNKGSANTNRLLVGGYHATVVIALSMPSSLRAAALMHLPPHHYEALQRTLNPLCAAGCPVVEPVASQRPSCEDANALADLSESTLLAGGDV